MHQKCVKTVLFSKRYRGQFGVHKQVNCGHSDHVLTMFSPFLHSYAPMCTIRMYLGPALCSHPRFWGEGLEERINYYTSLPLTLASNKQASKKQPGNTSPFRFRRSNALDFALLYPSHSLGVGLAESTFWGKHPQMAPWGGGAKSVGALP